MKALFEIVDGVDLVDDVDIEKTYPTGCVHSVHNVHSVHCLEESNWLQLPNLGSGNINYAYYYHKKNQFD